MQLKSINRDKFFDEKFSSATDEQYQKYLEVKRNWMAKIQDSDFSVLGIDIYRYSTFTEEKQIIVPIIFHGILRKTVNDILKYDAYIFSDFNDLEEFLKYFIDTGDGGFFIFPSPFQAFIFALFFQSNLRLFRTGMLYPFLLRDLKNDDQNSSIELRYAITYGKVYEMSANFYGPAIIDCSRLLSKDKLNRCLIDHNSIIWFEQECGGVENLSNLNYNEIQGRNLLGVTESPLESNLFFFRRPTADNSNMINRIDVQKLDEIKAKQQSYSAYNLYVQFQYTEDVKGIDQKMTVSLGNLNPQGIVD
jgi:hypothetical protein